MDCHFLLQGIFLTQGSNLHLLYLLHWQAGSLPLEPSGVLCIWWERKTRDPSILIQMACGSVLPLPFFLAVWVKSWASPRFWRWQTGNLFAFASSANILFLKVLFFLRFFFMWAILKLFIEFVIILLLFYVFGFLAMKNVGS